jgi:hypothetical protein
MLLNYYLRLSVILSFTCFVCVFIGCSKSTESQGPEPGALQSYLEQNPELNVEDDQSVDSEDEFGEGDGDS